jgi:hypothetical protein
MVLAMVVAIPMRVLTTTTAAAAIPGGAKVQATMMDQDKRAHELSR